MTKIFHKILVRILILTAFVSLAAFSIWVSVQSFQGYSLLSQPIGYIQQNGYLAGVEQDPSRKYLIINLTNSSKKYEIHKSLHDRQRYQDKFFNSEALASCLKIRCKISLETHGEDLFKFIRNSSQNQTEYVYSLISEDAEILPREKVQEELKVELNALYWLKIIMPIASTVMVLFSIFFIVLFFKEARRKTQ